MVIKVIATDTDGAFLTNNGAYDKVLFDRLFSKFMADDTKFVMASGSQYRQIIQQSPKHKRQMTLMAENGGHIIENSRTLQEAFKTEEATSALVNYIEKYYPDTVVNLTGKDLSYFPVTAPKKMKDLLNYYSPMLTYVDNLHLTPDDHLLKVTLLVRDDLTFKIRDNIDMLFAGYQSAATSNDFGYIDVIPSHVHEGTGPDFLLNHQSYTPENLIVFDDGGNDIEVLILAKYLFAMAGAPQEIETVVSYQAPSNQENGVLQVLPNHSLKGTKSR